MKGQWRDKKVIREYLETDGDETHCIKMRGTLKVVPRLHMQGELEKEYTKSRVSRGRALSVPPVSRVGTELNHS